MNVGKTLFAQLMEFIPWTSFTRIVNRYSGNSGVRRLSCAEQFRVMAFAQLTWRESLRDIVWFIRPETRTLGDLAQLDVLAVEVGVEQTQAFGVALDLIERRGAREDQHLVRDLRG